MYGLSDWFIDRIKGMYENARKFVQINGNIARAFRYDAQYGRDAL